MNLFYFILFYFFVLWLLEREGLVRLYICTRTFFCNWFVERLFSLDPRFESHWLFMIAVCNWRNFAVINYKSKLLLGTRPPYNASGHTQHCPKLHIINLRACTIVVRGPKKWREPGERDPAQCWARRPRLAERVGLLNFFWILSPQNDVVFGRGFVFFFAGNGPGGGRQVGWVGKYYRWAREPLGFNS